jgi:hypothetical protein
VRRRSLFRWGVVAVVVAVVMCLWAASRQRGGDPADATTTVYVTNTGKKYHRAGCSYLRQSQHTIPKGEAIKRGYGPCSKCNP